MWKVTGTMTLDAGPVSLPDFWVEADHPGVAQERAVHVYWAGRSLDGPINFTVSDGTQEHDGQILIRNTEPQVLQFSGGIFRVL